MFMKDYAKFTAKIAKGMKVGEDNVEIKLLVPLKVMQENFLFLSSKQEQKVNVFFGDPQAAFDFDDEDEEGEILRAVTGRRFTSDASGVVTSIEHREDDSNQTALFNSEDGDAEGEDQNEESDGDDGQDGAEVPDAGEDPDNEPGTADPEEGSTEPPAGPQHSTDEDDAGLYEDIAGEGGDRRLIDQDAPDWLQDIDPPAHGGGDVLAEGNGAGAPEDGAEEPQGSADAVDVDEQSEGKPAVADVDKDALDAFILAERPIFPEIEFEGKPVPFADLLEKRLNDKKTWRDVANENGMSSGQLSARWTEYKKLATKKMQGGGGAA